ncbi:hypothetical protein ACFQAT_16195 [Undibacterium arcticum]|uniref:NADH:flavin oxidoreductase/NADH oxidase N-terminal domain-containing protein n=1 Tax=Undibacterium arcticum TaxID=1762892 RepID=A0ABV7EUY8_9BURK
MTQKSSDFALQPFRVAGLTLRNRIVKAATFEGRTPNGQPGPDLTEFHARIARGGTALSTVSYCTVSPDARTFADQMYLHEAVFEPMVALASAVHAEGGAVSGQLAHCGAFKRSAPVESPRPLGPSRCINQYGLLSGIPRNQRAASLRAAHRR